MNRESTKSRIENETTRNRSDNSIFNPMQIPGLLTFSKVPSEVAEYDTHFQRKVFPAWFSGAVHPHMQQLAPLARSSLYGVRHI